MMFAMMKLTVLMISVPQPTAKQTNKDAHTSQSPIAAMMALHAPWTFAILPKAAPISLLIPVATMDLLAQKTPAPLITKMQMKMDAYLLPMMTCAMIVLIAPRILAHQATIMQ